MIRIVYYFTVCLVSIFQLATAQSDSIPRSHSQLPGLGTEATGKKDGDEGTINKELAAFLSYNFSGNAKGLEKLTPIVDYGWSTNLVEKDKFKWDLSINPYAAGQIDIDEKDSYIPGLMLPGSAGLKIHNFLTLDLSTRGQLIFAPINFGYKIISNFADSATYLAQHNWRPGLSYRLGDFFILGFQYNFAWHNSTSASQNSFEKVFERKATDLQYVSITLQTRITSPNSTEENKISGYLFVEWRGLSSESRKKFEGFDNHRIITFGIRTNMSIENAFPAARPAARPFGN